MNLGWLEPSFLVADVGRTTAWYEKLGFLVVDTADEGRTNTVEAGDCRIALFQGVLDPAETQLIFWNGDVEAIADWLQAAGVEFVKPSTHAEHADARGVVRMPNGDASFMVRDPDGQLLFLIRMAKVSRQPAAPSPGPERGRCEIALPVKDVATTEAFYKLLGFSRDMPPEDDRMAALINGQTRINLYQGYLDPPELQLNFWQGDIDGVADLVRRQGLGFYREPGRDDAGQGFMLTDPDGRPLFFINMVKYRTADA